MNCGNARITFAGLQRRSNGKARHGGLPPRLWIEAFAVAAGVFAADQDGAFGGQLQAQSEGLAV